jgi:triacylglycerol esterase/lipase EstA (alpha/beta hydrolase family)
MQFRNNYPVVLVHGFMGWGAADNINKSFPYFGYGVRDSLFKPKNSQNVPNFDIFQASVGPFSSFWDRACELIAQIKGLKVDYTEEHAKEFGHDRYGKNYTKKGFYPQWDEDHPIHLVAHSAGGHTCTYAQYILANDLLGIGSNEKWIKSITGIAPSWNGGVAPYIIAVDKDGTLDNFLGRVIADSVKIVGGVFDKISQLFYDFDIEHYNYEKKQNENIVEYIKRITKPDSLTTGKDNLGYGLALNGGYEACELMNTYPDTYYFSYTTKETHSSFWNFLPWNDNVQIPDIDMNPFLSSFSRGIGSIKNEQIPADVIPGWGTGEKIAEHWRANDGIVSVVSQKYPWISENKKHPVGGNIAGKTEFTKGQWHYDSITKLVGGKHDHLDPVMFPNLELFSEDADKIKTFWRDLYCRLANLE